jgi:hypothetical protein
MKVIKPLLLLGVALALSACETLPIDEATDQDRYAAPLAPSHSMTDPRSYMDKPDPNLQRMLSGSYYFMP